MVEHQRDLALRARELRDRQIRFAQRRPRDREPASIGSDLP